MTRPTNAEVREAIRFLVDSLDQESVVPDKYANTILAFLRPTAEEKPLADGAVESEAQSLRRIANVCAMYLHEDYATELRRIADNMRDVAPAPSLPDTDLEDRDRAEDMLGKLAALAGCKEEWSNLHYHGECIAEVLRQRDTDREALRKVADRIEKSIASAENDARGTRHLAWELAAASWAASIRRIVS